MIWFGARTQEIDAFVEGHPLPGRTTLLKNASRCSRARFAHQQHALFDITGNGMTNRKLPMAVTKPNTFSNPVAGPSLPSRRTLA